MFCESPTLPHESIDAPPPDCAATLPVNEFAVSVTVTEGEPPHPGTIDSAPPVEAEFWLKVLFSSVTNEQSDN